MAGYKAVVEKQLKSKFAWPAGWDRREKVAGELGCSPDRVAEVLREAIRAGVVERKEVKLFEDGRFQRVMGYRVVAK